MNALTYNAFQDELEKIANVAAAKALLSKGVSAAKKGSKAFQANEAAMAGSAIGGGMGAYSNKDKGFGSALRGALIGGAGGAAVGAGMRHAAPGLKRFTGGVAEDAGARAAKGAVKKRSWLFRKLVGEG